MSDISKRIHSIDPVADNAPLPKSLTPKSSPNDVPDFVTRAEPIIPLLQTDEHSNGWLIWTGIILALLWVVAAGAFFYFQPLNNIQSYTPENIFFLAAATLFPAILIVLFFISTRKLQNMTRQVEGLTAISQNLLRADETAASQSSNLASSIRQQMNMLNEDLANLTDRLRFLQDNASDHAESLQSSSSSFLATSDVIGQNLTIQRQSLESMAQTTEAKLDSLSALVSSHEKTLKETTDASYEKIETAGSILEERLAKYQEFVTEAESQLLKTSETLEGSKSKTSDVLQSLEENSTTISEKIEALKSENESLKALMEERLNALELLNKSNQEANSILSETIQHSITATDKMKEEALQTEQALSTKREEMEQFLATTDAKIKQTTQEQNALIFSKLDETEGLLAKLDGRVDRLQRNADAVEAEQLANAETHEMGLEIPKQITSRTQGGRLNLKPLDVEAGNFEPEIYQDDTPLDLTLNTSMETLPLDDVIQPLSRPEPIFGTVKKKEKSPWRWKDMMGGFDNSPETPVMAPSIPQEPQIEPQELNQRVQSYEAWLKDFDLNADAIVSDGTILDFANGMIQTPNDIMDILELRMPDISEHLRALATDNAGFAEAAKITSEQFGNTINAEIMNRDAIRNRLSTRDGKAYLLALLSK